MPKPNILILESIHPDGIELLKEDFNVIDGRYIDNNDLDIFLPLAKVVIIKSLSFIDDDFLSKAKALKVIARAGTGVDNINLVAAYEKGIDVLTVPCGNSKSAAEFALLLILFSIRRIKEVIEATERGDFRRHLYEGRQLNKLTIGIIGYGNVGKILSETLSCMGCKVLTWDILQPENLHSLPKNVHFTQCLDELLKESDVISLHARLTDKSRNFLSYNEFKKMKKGVYIVNTARAELVDNNALIDSIDNGIVAGASVDVISPEPNFELTSEKQEFSHPFLFHDKIFVTPHVGASTFDAQRAISMDLARQILRANT